MASLFLGSGKVAQKKVDNFCFRHKKSYHCKVPRINTAKKGSFSIMASLSSSSTGNSVGYVEEEFCGEIIGGPAKEVPGLGIVDFLKGKCLLVTGATGFLGKGGPATPVSL